MKKTINWCRLLWCLTIPCAVGALSAFLTRDNMSVFEQVTKPALTPPGWVFPIAWTVLYLLMGFASYRISVAPAPFETRKMLLIVYGIQLFFNFVWPLLFFNLRNYGAALVWLIVLWALVVWLTYRTKSVDEAAFWCLVPYVLWLTFAAYLNLSIYLNN